MRSLFHLSTLIAIFMTVAPGEAQESPSDLTPDNPSWTYWPESRLESAYGEVACDAMSARPCHSGRAFLFGWPGQRPQDFLLDYNEPLVTDRPGFTEASSTVGRGVTQFEMGYTYFTDKSEGERTDLHTYPEFLIRRGILRDWLEFRMAYTAASVNDLGGSRTGSVDLYLGLKIGLTPQLDWLPEMSLIPQMFVPTGNTDFTADQVLPGLNWIYAWDVTDNTSFSGSTGFQTLTDSETERDFLLWTQSLAAGASLTETIGAYAEWFAFFPDDADTERVQHFFNGGFTKLFSNNIQWDIRAGVGLNEAAEDFFVGTGLSIRVR